MSAGAQSAAAGGRRERLAFVYHPFSFGVHDIAAAARERCELIWVTDSSMAEVELMTKLLRRLGGVVDIAGAEPHEAAALIAAHEPDGILCLADSLLTRTAAIAAELTLPFHTPAVAARLSDKLEQARALTAAGVATAQTWPLPQSAAGWRELERQLSFPALLKPRRGEGSRDVTAVGSLTALRERVEALDERERVATIVQTYLPDRAADPGIPPEFAGYVSIESIVSAGTASHVAIMGRTPPAEPFRESGFFIPAALREEDRDAVLSLAGAAIAALGVDTGTLHTEVKLTPTGASVIEVNGRLGGGTSQLLASVAEIDLLAIALRLALGETIVLEGPLPTRGVAYDLYLHAPVSMRRIVAIDGVERLRADPRVARVAVNRGPGSHVDWREGNWGHVLSIEGVARDHQELTAIVRALHEHTRIAGE